MRKKADIGLTDQQISEQISWRVMNASTDSDGERMYRDHLLPRYVRVVQRVDRAPVGAAPSPAHRRRAHSLGDDR
jgi:hypothetical protein